MPMRGVPRRARPKASVDLRHFGWDRALVATLRHATLPWTEALDPAPLIECDDLGPRDKLSLVAQFAAHQAFLQVAGVGDGECDPREWAVLRELLLSPNSRWRADDASAVRAAAALGAERVVEIGADASPLQRYSAIATLGPVDRSNEGAIVERVLERASRERLLFIVTARER